MYGSVKAWHIKKNQTDEQTVSSIWSFQEQHEVD